MDDYTATPAATWPANHRAALIVLIHVDAPDPRADDTRLAPGLDYAVTGLQRLLHALGDLDLPATLAWSPRALATFPQLARSAQDGGHELAISRVTEPAFEDEAGLLKRISDIPLGGVVETFPGFGPVEGATAGATQGLTWSVTGASGDVPVSTVADGRQGSTIIPVSPYWIDTAWLAPDRPLPPSSFLEMWSLSLAAVRAEGTLMTVVLHPHVAGRPGIAGQVVRFLDEVIESGDVWIATAAQVAAWWRQTTESET